MPSDARKRKTNEQEKGRTWGVHMGALADPIAKQAAEQGVEVEGVEHFQADADAITRLAVQGLITDAQKVAARKKLMKRIGEAATFVGGGNDAE